jgi:NAD(P)H-dependent FMN reductase
MKARAPIKILGISGSLRAASSASAILRQVAELAGPEIQFQIYDGLATIPAFDDGPDMPSAVLDFIDRVNASDGVFFCIPEYAFGVPGALKNALDWTVSTTAFNEKPVALITAASSGEKAHAALRLTLTALQTRMENSATLLISFVRSKLDEQKKIKDTATLQAVKEVIAHFKTTVQQKLSEEPAS